jgi:hypothetical protein
VEETPPKTSRREREQDDDRAAVAEQPKAAKHSLGERAKPAPRAVERVELPPAPPRMTAPLNDAQIARVRDRLAASLTKELAQNFELFLYVSKADRGPWAQHMYVFERRNGALKALYAWPVSTGREKVEYNSRGEKLPSYTTAGYYQLDPARSYRKYRSVQWGQNMPFAMFFTWVKDGYQTGLAIHAADGATDIGLLGSRSSAGCVRLAPGNAEFLYNLIRQNYRGRVPQFAYDRHTDTMSNDGMLKHDKQGNLVFANGYKVLVFIENYGGQDTVAALF